MAHQVFLLWQKMTHGFVRHPAHDRSDVFRKEKALLNWLKGMSVAKLFDWFDAVQETTVDSPMGKARWRTETIERDRLFLTRLGVLKS